MIQNAIGAKIDTLILNADGRPLSLIPLSVIPWQSSIRLIFLEKVKVLKEYDDWVLRSQRMEMKVPSILMMSEHVRWTRQPKYNRSNVYLRDNFTCQLQASRKCRELGGQVPYHELTLDHVVPKSQGGKTNWTNICTSCKECNSEKGNNEEVRPSKKPHKPTYYELLAKRRNLPVYIRDPEWAHYIDWPEHLIKLVGPGR